MGGGGEEAERRKGKELSTRAHPLRCVLMVVVPAVVPPAALQPPSVAGGALKVLLVLVLVLVLVVVVRSLALAAA